LSQCSTGLGRRARRNAAARGGKTALTVYSYNQAAAITGLARRTLERLIAVGGGPPVIELSSRRRGILETDLQIWLNSRRRLASSDAPATAPPLLDQFAGGHVRPGVPASLRAPGEKKARSSL
jgi:hypothetical protein